MSSCHTAAVPKDALGMYSQRHALVGHMAPMPQVQTEPRAAPCLSGTRSNFSSSGDGDLACVRQLWC